MNTIKYKKPVENTQKSQDFFPKKVASSTKNKGFIFNQAPINKKEVKENLQEDFKIQKDKGQKIKNKRSAFMAKLYEDDFGDFDNEMKVFNMSNDNSDNEQQTKSMPAMDDLEKQNKKAKFNKEQIKIGKLRFSKGSLGLFAINEIHSKYIIVNFTRNVKGYIPLDMINDKTINDQMRSSLEVGQFIIASIQQEGTYQYNFQTSGNQNKKLQLSLNLQTINQSLASNSIQNNMVLQGIVESKEAKGYLINFQMKDQTKGFITFSQDTSHLQVGQLVLTIVKQSNESSKIVKCDILNKQNTNLCLPQTGDYSLHTLKPGVQVNAKVTQLFDNGIEVSFLAGFNGNIFCDHLTKEKFKIGEKVTARIISVDPLAKCVNLSLLPHIISMKSTYLDLIAHSQVGKVFDNVKISKVVYGNSYIIELDEQNNKMKGFLHKIHSSTVENDESDVQQEQLEQGQKIDKVIVKEINYFDGMPILSMKEALISTPNLVDYSSIKVGMFTNGTILSVNEEEKYIILQINDFVKGKLHIEHMADFPIKIMPPRFKEIGKQIKLRVWNVDQEKRILEFTKKDTFMKENTKFPIYNSYKEVQKGSKIMGIVVGENEYGYIIKSFGGVKGLISFKEIKDNGKKIKQDYLFGSIVKGYVLFKKKDQGMAITLSKKIAKELKETEQLKLNTENKTTFEEIYLPNETECDLLKQKYKSMINASKDISNIGKVMQFRIVESKDNYYIAKSIDSSKKILNILSILPKCLLQSEIQLAIKTDENIKLYSCLVIDIINGIPLISNQDNLISNAALMPQIPEDIVETENQKVFYGIINNLTQKGLVVRFKNGLKKHIFIKEFQDEELKQSAMDKYKVGQIILTKLSNKGRLVLHENKKPKKDNLQINKQLMPRGAQNLNQEILAQMISSFADLKEGQTYKAQIKYINIKVSQPIEIYLSPFVKGKILFNQIATVQQILMSGGIENIINKLKIGQVIDVYYQNEQLSLIKQSSDSQIKLEKEQLVTCRYVKSINGKGVTVQINEKIFGFIEICEITDEICGQVLQILQDKQIFVARIIDQNNNSNLVLSTRESILDQERWTSISPSGKSIKFQQQDLKLQKLGNQRNKILKFGLQVSLQEGDLCQGYIINVGKSGCFVQIGHNSTVRAALNELSDNQSFNYMTELPLGRLIFGRIIKVEEQKDNIQKRFHLSLRKSIVVFGSSAISKEQLVVGKQVEAIVIAIIGEAQEANGTTKKIKAYAQIKGSFLKIKVKKIINQQLKEGETIIANISKINSQKITGIFQQKVQNAKESMNEQEKLLEQIWMSVQEESQKDVEFIKKQVGQKEIDQQAIQPVQQEDNDIEMQIEDLQALKQMEIEESEDNEEGQNEEQEGQENEDSEVEEMQNIIQQSKFYSDEDSNESNNEQEEGKDIEQQQNKQTKLKQENIEMESDEEKKEGKQIKGKSGKQGLKDRVREEQEIRKKEILMRDNNDQPKNIDDFERLLFQNQDQSYVWIQYLSFMLDNLGVESARKVAERAVKSISISNEDDKLNLWIAYMNLENCFGTQALLQKVVKRALEVNERKKVYLALINIYQTSSKYQYIEDIFKLLSKKYNTSLKIWSAYLDFLFELRKIKQYKNSPLNPLVHDLEYTEPKQILSKALQSLPQIKHINLISKFGMLEYKYGNPENGRTMFEGIVNNYPKRMDIWSIYMDMEVKYGGSENKQQARHLFERCLNNEFIKSKPKKMKLVFQKYMEFEMINGLKKNVEKLRVRVEEYLDTAYGNSNQNGNTKVDQNNKKTIQNEDKEVIEEDQENNLD